MCLCVQLQEIISAANNGFDSAFQTIRANLLSPSAQSHFFDPLTPIEITRSKNMTRVRWRGVPVMAVCGS